MTDLIDRRAAIELFTRKENEFIEKFSPSIRPKFAESIARVLAKLPSADPPEVVRCEDCVKRHTTRCALWYGELNRVGIVLERGDDFGCIWGDRRANDG